MRHSFSFFNSVISLVPFCYSSACICLNAAISYSFYSASYSLIFHISLASSCNLLAASCDCTYPSLRSFFLSVNSWSTPYYSCTKNWVGNFLRLITMLSNDCSSEFTSILLVSIVAKGTWIFLSYKSVLIVKKSCIASFFGVSFETKTKIESSLTLTMTNHS